MIMSIVFINLYVFQDMIDDWSSKYSPDLLYFVPYTWKFNFLFNKKFELVTLANEFNWIDTSSTNQENMYVGICLDKLQLAFDLPYVEFLSEVIPYKFDIKVSTGIINCRMT